MSEKLKQKSVQFPDDRNGVNTIFTDVIRINVNMETVTLELGIKNRDGLAVEVTDKVIMTLPHFMRFTEVCHKSALSITNQINEKIKEQNDSNS